jgi:hypothetical protein
MKTLKLSSLLIFLLFNVFSAEAQDLFKKELRKTYPANENIKFRVINKFGKIHIENTVSNNIEIVVTLSVKAADRKRADVFFKTVQIKFSNSDSLIQAVTEIEDDVKVKEFSIDYDIKMPENTKLDLQNKYGDVYIDKLTACSKIDVKYGNLKANTLKFGDVKPRTLINLAYSNAVIDACDWLKIDSKYSKLHIRESEGLIIKSKYSQIDIKKATFIAAESKYDQPYRISEVKNLSMNGKYSSPEIGKLGSLLDADLKYTDLTIENVSQNFTKIDLRMSYGNAEIEFAPTSSYSLSGSSDYGSINIPESNNLKEISQKSESKIEGFIGKNTKSTSSVSIMLRYGNVELK